jgi:cell division protein FtsQ
VRRRFPDAVEVSFEAYRALARWGDALVSPQGEVFAGETTERLPRLTGPEGSAPEMVRQLPAIAGALAPLGSPLAALRLSPRGAWLAELESGLVLEIGREDINARLARFAAAWPRIAADGAAPRYADLRYPNGFALRRPEVAAERAVKPARQPARRA